MNAKHIKTAFFYKSPVFCDDKEHPIKLGVIKQVIYYLSHSGKVHCDGVVQSLASKDEEPVRISCRYIHYFDNSRKKSQPKTEPNEHTEAIKNAFINVLPVVTDVPNVGTVEGNIKEIIYWRTDKGNIQCSANIIDKFCPKSTVQARLKYISVKQNLII